MRSRPPRPQRNHGLYGDADGAWAILEFPGAGWAPPESIAGLRYLAPAEDAILSAYAVIPRIGSGPGALYPAQAMLCRLTGLAQTTVSLHTRKGGAVPRISDEGWAALTRLLYALGDWPGKPRDKDALRAFLVTGDLIRAEREGW